MANSASGGWAARLAAYLHERLPAAETVAIARASPMSEGASNDTLAIDVRVTCDGFEWLLPLVLRPQRPDGILAPYDVGRQFRVLRALSGTVVPVPAVAWFEPGQEPIGVPFFLMERIEGEPLPMVCDRVTPDLLAAAGALAAVHAVDIEKAGLSFLAPGSDISATGIELEAWRQRADYLRIGRTPWFTRLAAWLTANEPADARVGLLHGDPNPTNYLLREGRVAAVLDWELAGLGDPRSDLGFYSALLTVFHTVPEVGGRTALSDAYEQVTGRKLENLAYYEVLGLYKMAMVMSGWQRVTGQSNSYSMDAISRRLSLLAGPL